ncbi:alpha/beta-hydrolase [Aureobasidium sp. EXF-10728]|nr:alpha/beta-hydrolase [Aureobasidium sp. EXF-10728]
MKHGTIQLPTKPTTNLSYSFLPGDPTTNTLVVFLNGLILPKSSWEQSITAIQFKLQDLNSPRPHLLSYDRYGQGTSDKHPDGKHDVLDVAHDLHTLLTVFCTKELEGKKPVHLVFVCNSIGCAIARLFCANYPDMVSGLLFLDSIMAHVDLVALWPDVDAIGFDQATLPEGVTKDKVKSVREEYRKKFHVSAPNPEELDRSTLAELLPRADGPKLQGPFLTVVGHDYDTFAQENENSFGVPKALVMKYVNPVWHQYNKGLATLTDIEKSKGPIIAKGCGHFIQRDDPEFVATEVCDLLHRLEKNE